MANQAWQISNVFLPLEEVAVCQILAEVGLRLGLPCAVEQASWVAEPAYDWLVDFHIYQLHS